jgi:hypothetical protein
MCISIIRHVIPDFPKIVSQYELHMQKATVK